MDSRTFSFPFQNLLGNDQFASRDGAGTPRGYVETARLGSMPPVPAGPEGSWEPTTSVFPFGGEAYYRGYSATTLNDGRVAVYNWDGVGSATGLLYFYTPATGLWSRGADSPLTSGAYSVLLSDGRLLITQTGLGGSSQWFTIYDPATNTYSAESLFADTGSTAYPSPPPGLPVALPDGRVLFIGQYLPGAWGTQFCNLWDPATNTWTAAADYPSCPGAAVLLKNGKVFVGASRVEQGGVGPKPETYLYDVAGNTWAAAASHSATRYSQALTALLDGRALLVGGIIGPHGSLLNTADCRIYDPITNAWTATPPHWGFVPGDAVSATLADGRVFVTSIGNTGSTFGQAAELFAPRDASTVFIRNKRVFD